jgi:hypothetical protein
MKRRTSADSAANATNVTVIVCPSAAENSYDCDTAAHFGWKDFSGKKNYMIWRLGDGWRDVSD